MSNANFSTAEFCYCTSRTIEVQLDSRLRGNDGPTTLNCHSREGGNPENAQQVI